MEDSQEIFEPQVADPNAPLIEGVEGEVVGEDNKDRWKSIFFELVETLALALILYLIINMATARIRVDGSSMFPAFQDGNFVIVNRLAYRFGEIERGDVIVFPYPNNPEEDFIKRVVALPGDRISLNQGKVLINGILLEEPYIMEPARSQLSEFILPEGVVWVMGDNRNASSDSRSWGVLPVEDIMGKAVFTYWPFSEFGVVTHYDLDGQIELYP